MYFVHIPKTAGNSIRKAMHHAPWFSNNGSLKKHKEHHFASKNAHRVIDSCRSFDTDRFPSYLEDSSYHASDFSFTAVRNPYDLLVSYFTHTNRTADDGWMNVNSYHDINSFEQFIDLYTSIDPEDWHVPSLCKNLFGQIFCDEGKAAVDYTIFTENLINGIELLANFANSGFDSSLPYIECNNLTWENVSPRRNKKNYEDYYNESMIKKVRKKCEWELDTFEYSYGSINLSRTVLDLSSMALES